MKKEFSTLINKERREVPFVHFISKSLTTLLGEIISEGTLSFFRRTAEVSLGGSQSGNSPFQLYLINKEILDNHKGTFSFSVDNEKFLVFRKPAEIRMSYILQGNHLSGEQRLKTHDRLLSFFFDSSSIDPFLPDSYKKYPDLFKVLQSKKAELKQRNLAGDVYTNGIDATADFHFCFEYTALYHSGNPLREDRKTTQRVIDYGKHSKSNERSIQ